MREYFLEHNPHNLRWLELSLMVERVINTLSLPEIDLSHQQIIFGKARVFLEEVLRGMEVVKTLRLTTTTTKDLESLRLARLALRGLTERELPEEDRDQNFRKIHATLKKLSIGGKTAIKTEEAQEISQFFQALNKVVEGIKPEQGIDKVNIRW